MRFKQTKSTDNLLAQFDLTHKTLSCLYCLGPVLPSHSSFWIVIFITEEATGDGNSSQQRVVEVSPLHLTGAHLTSLCDTWQSPTSQQICQRLRRIIEIAGTLILRRDWSVLWHPLIFLSRPLPDFWHPVIFLWPLHRHCVHYSQVFCHPSQRARSVPCPPTTQTWVPTCTQCMSDHLTTHPTALLPPTDETISRNLYRPQLPTHRAYSFSCFVSSELSWYVQPDTKTYQVTIWRRLSPTDINVGTWVFVNNFGKKGLWRKYFNERKYPIWVMSITQKLS